MIVGITLINGFLFNDDISPNAIVDQLAIGISWGNHSYMKFGIKTSS